jgi:hypothetical protein
MRLIGLAVVFALGLVLTPGIRRCQRWHALAGYDLQLPQYDDSGRRATFYVTGMEHSLTSDTSSAWEPTPWRAVQVTTREAARKAEERLP